MDSKIYLISSITIAMIGLVYYSFVLGRYLGHKKGFQDALTLIKNMASEKQSESLTKKEENEL